MPKLRPKHHCPSIWMCACLNFAKNWYILVWFQKFGQGLIFQVIKKSLHIHLTMMLTCMPPKIDMQTPKIAPTTAKTVFVPNSCPKITIFCVCVQMFGKNKILNLSAILLYNHSIIMNTWMAAKSGTQKADLACTICSCPTLPKRITPGRNENEFSCVLKIKNYS